jgi:hypothetical protein
MPGRSRSATSCSTMATTSSASQIRPTRMARAWRVHSVDDVARLQPPVVGCLVELEVDGPRGSGARPGAAHRHRVDECACCGTAPAGAASSRHSLVRFLLMAWPSRRSSTCASSNPSADAAERSRADGAAASLLHRGSAAGDGAASSDADRPRCKRRCETPERSTSTTTARRRRSGVRLPPGDGAGDRSSSGRRCWCSARRRRRGAGGPRGRRR